MARGKLIARFQFYLHQKDTSRRRPFSSCRLIAESQSIRGVPVGLGLSISYLLLGMTSIVQIISSKEDGPERKKTNENGEKTSSLRDSAEHNFGFLPAVFPTMARASQCERSQHAPNYRHRDHDDPSGLLSPTLPYRTLRPNPHLEIAFCCRTRNPIYVLEKDVLYTTTIDNGDGGSAGSERNFRSGRNRRPKFFEEKSIPPNMRSRLSDYKHSGWDRGHLAPAADFAPKRSVQGIDKQRTEEQRMQEQMQTYNLCNVSPQDASLNRDLWSKLEQWVRTTILELQKEEDEMEMEMEMDRNVSKYSIEPHDRRRQVHVVTGPLWLPTHHSFDLNQLEYRYIGIGEPPSLVAVPTHFFKVVVVVANGDKKDDSRIEKFACFVMVNGPRQSDNANDGESNARNGGDEDQLTLQDFLVPWSTLEMVSGLQFFSKFIDDDFRNTADALTRDQMDQREQQRRSLTTSALQVLQVGKSTSKGGGRRQQRKGINAALLQHLCNGGKCRV